MPFHPSVAKALSELKQRRPNVKLAAFGQTVFWDEPMKSVLVPMLEAYHPGAEMIVGPHDADYFGRCPGLNRAVRFVTCEHNDGPTREMWAAVAEASALFGSEDVPTHAQLTAAGVDFERLSRANGARHEQLIQACTTAWGWRAVVDAHDGRSVFRDIATKDAATAIEGLLEWALNETLARIDSPSLEHRQAADDVLAALRRRARDPANRSLTRLYQSMWPHFYERLLGRWPERVQVASTCSLFRFNRQTCTLPRFRLVDHFLDPETGPICREAYSASLEGTGIYELERFGSGALPFDLVVPGRGRGTISLTDAHLIVDTEPHTVVDLPRTVRSVEDLAAAVEEALGPDVALVGKAVATAFMLTSEFVFVLNEGGSAYVPRTREMAQRLAEAGISGCLNPVLRMRYPTWDTLADLDLSFRLPEHLAAAFEDETIAAKDLAKRWRSVVKQQEKLLKALARARSPQDLMRLLTHEDHPKWLDKLDAYVQAHRELLDMQRTIEDSKHRADHVREEIKSLKAEVDKLQKLRGKISRIVKPLRSRLEELERAGAPEGERRAIREELQCYAKGELPDTDVRLAELRERVARLEAERKDTTARYRALETGRVARDARKRLAAFEAAAEATRLRLATHAIRTTRSLPHIDNRPTAWWLPVVDPSGAWYRAILENTELVVEDMG